MATAKKCTGSASPYVDGTDEGGRCRVPPTTSSLKLWRTENKYSAPTTDTGARSVRSSWGTKKTARKSRWSTNSAARAATPFHLEAAGNVSGCPRRRMSGCVTVPGAEGPATSKRKGASTSSTWTSTHLAPTNQGAVLRARVPADPAKTIPSSRIRRDSVEERADQ